MNFVHLDEVPSTNTWLAQHAAELPSGTFVTAGSQTAGRGQRGNSWESQPGCNLTFSMLLRLPGFAARWQFSISEAVALAMCDALRDRGIEARVKWPNDIYVGDRKIAGILIEHSVMGMDLQHTIVGVGLNVNQEAFTSPAPNPVSMWQLTGEKYDLEELKRDVARALEGRLGYIATDEQREAMHSCFKASLWRGRGLHPFRDTATDDKFHARIADVEPMGMLVLETADGDRRRYAFKEVEFLLPQMS